MPCSVFFFFIFQFYRIVFNPTVASPLHAALCAYSQLVPRPTRFRKLPPPPRPTRHDGKTRGSTSSGVDGTGPSRCRRRRPLGDRRDGYFENKRRLSSARACENITIRRVPTRVRRRAGPNRFVTPRRTPTRVGGTACLPARVRFKTQTPY